jgi:hypothetical protein
VLSFCSFPLTLTTAMTIMVTRTDIRYPEPTYTKHRVRYNIKKKNPASSCKKQVSCSQCIHKKVKATSEGRAQVWLSHRIQSNQHSLRAQDSLLWLFHAMLPNAMITKGTQVCVPIANPLPVGM